MRALPWLAAAALVAGCGGDDEPAPPRDSAAAPTEDAREEAPGGERPMDGNPTETAAEPGERKPPPPSGGSPEDQPGGAGDEIPAYSEALITGRGGRLTPRVVRVPPFISVRVRLRSADDARYSLAGGGRTITAGGGVAAMTADFDGLRPGRRFRLDGPAGSVTIEASAEPGP